LTPFDARRFDEFLTKSSIGIGLVIYLSFAQLFLSTGAAPAGHGHGAEL